MTQRTELWLALAMCAFWCPGGGAGVADEPDRFARWEAAIAKFEQQDLEQPPPKQGIVFVGSSSIRLWNLSQAFPGQPVLNRGFGGSQLADSVHFCERLVLKHEPRTVVLYAGDNDVSVGVTPEQVAQDFTDFVKIVRAKLPETAIVYISIKPSPARWKLADKAREANRRIAEACAAGERLTFVDVFTPMLGEDGQPRAELFVKDNLHMNAAGYELWNALVGAALESKNEEARMNNE